MKETPNEDSNPQENKGKLNETTEVRLDNDLSGKALYDRLTQIACEQLHTSNTYKKPLLEKWRKYEDLKAGNIKPKLRMPHNIPIPVFSGMLDTLAADFDEPIELEFKKKHPSDYFKAKKIQAAWNLEKNSTDVNARWDYKARVDKSNNLICGRSILKEYAESDPTYKNYLEVVSPYTFHSQPDGGGLLENHLWLGQEGINRTLSYIEDNRSYDYGQVRELKSKSKATTSAPQLTEDHKQKMSKYAALGLNPEAADFNGEETYNLCEWGLTYRGVRYYLLFDPWTCTWLRCEKLKDIFSMNLWPWVSWATHEDDKVFWSISYADIIYPVAEAIIALFNQELANREKRNMGARAYDKDMFTDVAKLDAAQYRPDALVPVDTKGGSRKIADGIYWFQTPELMGTINLLDWMNKSLQTNTGVTDISQGSAMQASKKVNVAYMEQASVAKRIGYKSQSYTECWGEIGVRYYQGLKDHMSKDMYIEILGDTGIEPDVLTRDDLELKGKIGVQVISSTARKQESRAKREAKVKALELLKGSPNVNSEWMDESVMRYVGEFSEDEIKIALDTRNYASRESIAKAHICIEEMLNGIKPLMNYAADAVFLKIIFEYMMEHRNKLGVERGKMFAEYLAEHAQIANQNGQRSGALRGQKNARAQMAAGTAQPIENQPKPQPEMAQV